jgi:hypothetical protein
LSFVGSARKRLTLSPQASFTLSTFEALHRRPDIPVLFPSGVGGKVQDTHYPKFRDQRTGAENQGCEAISTIPILAKLEILLLPDN